MRLLLFKLLATTLVAATLLYPFIEPNLRVGVIASLEAIGLLEALMLTTIFLSAVALYCRTLQRCLQLIRPEVRTIRPRSVWYMFLIPYNFVEDFFIINNVTKSLRAEAQLNSSMLNLKSFGAVSGFGWCTAQIVSLVPTQVGEAASVIALILWIVHWRLITRVNKLLSEGSPRATVTSYRG